MRCEDADLLIELGLDGAGFDPALEAHLGDCAACQARLALARAIEDQLRQRPVPEPPARFTAAVLTRIGRERWRAEQLVDAGFNATVAAGGVLVLVGLAGLTASFGGVSIDPAVVDVATSVARQWAGQAAGQVSTVALAAALLTGALALWRWVEGDRT